MKKSRVAVFAALGFLLLMIVIIMGLGKVVLGSAIRADEDGFGGKTAHRRAEFSGFDRISIVGAWELEIVQAEEFSVEIEYPEGSNNLATQQGSILIFEDTSWEFGESYSARVEMPTLSEINIAGAGDVMFTGFAEKSLTVAIDGAGRVRAEDSSAKDLNVQLEGLGQVDMEDLLSTNAEVYLEGAGEVRLHMAGGILKGHLEGLGNIRYAGELKEQNIKEEGFGEVLPLD